MFSIVPVCRNLVGLSLSISQTIHDSPQREKSFKTVGIETESTEVTWSVPTAEVYFCAKEKPV